jgi:spore germination protein YaaH
MKKKLYLLLLIGIFITNRGFSEEVKVHKTGYIAHYAKYSNKKLGQYSKEYDTLAVTGYSVTENGNIQIQKPSFHNQFISKYKNVFLPVLTLSSSKAGIKILTDEKLSDRCADEILVFLDSISHNSIQFDFEYVPSRYNSDYAKLLRLLKEKRPSLFISVCIAPPLETDPKYAGFFDVRALDPYADEFMLMSYDYHGPLNKHGPVTDVQWTEKNLRFLLQHTSHKKMILGAPLYGYWWESNGKERVFTERKFYSTFQQSEIVRMEEGTVTLKNLDKTEYRYLSVGDSTTVELFKMIALKYKLKGIGIWRLGFEK